MNVHVLGSNASIFRTQKCCHGQSVRYITVQLVYFCNLPVGRPADLKVKALKRIIFYSLLVVGVLLATLIISVWLFQDRIINSFVAEANKSLNTPVAIGKISVSAWKDFPNLAIVFHDVYVEDSHPGKDTLLAAKTISFTLNPVEVWQGQYDVRGLKVENSITRLRINTVGKSNYNIIKEGGRGGGTIVFDLKDVQLVNTEVSYDDLDAHQFHRFDSKNLDASIHIVGDLYQISAKGDVTSRQINVNDLSFLVDKEFSAVAEIDYDDENKIVTIKPSGLELGNSAFEITGVYSFKTKNEIDISANGMDTDIQTILSLLPKEFSERFKDYQSEGNIYFSLAVKGEMSKNRDPLFSIAFGCSGASLYHPKFDSRITGANLEGSFATPSFSSLRDAELFLKNVRGSLNGKSFTSDFALRNFENPFITLEFNGLLDARSILQFYPVETVSKVSGLIDADLFVQGEVGKLKRRATAQEVKTSGKLRLENLGFTAGDKPVTFAGISGTLQFNNNDMALSDTYGQIGNSDFRLNGMFKNSIPYLLYENQPIGIEADLQARHLDADELFSIVYGDDRASGDYNFSISPNLHFNFNCDIKSLHYKRFKPRRMRGNLLIKNQMAVFRKLSVNAMGGSITLDGIADAKNPKAIDIVSTFKLSGVHLDSLFYVFNNFDQNFVQDKHLRGQAFADISTEMVLNNKLNLFSESLIADVSVAIKNGELNDFDPLQELKRYLDDEGLAKLRFADLKNDIHIENKTIFIPQMEIRSNVTNITLSGTHTFDQKIDYRVVAPLRSRKKIDPDEAFGAIESDNAGGAKVFLKITGTTDDYDVSYDKRALKQKLASDLKNEVKELREAVKLKGKQKKKEVELSEDEFDWDN